MKKYFPHLLLGMLMMITSCSDSNEIEEVVTPVENEPEDVVTNPDADINSFLYSAMYDVYRWKDEVPVLENDYFTNNAEYNDYIQESGTPMLFLETLVYNRETVDFYTRYISDYAEDDSNLAGNQGTNGVNFGLARYGDNKVLGYVQFILPDSDADGKDIGRGDLFTEVDGRELTLENYRNLLYSDKPTYTLTMARLVGNTITPTGTTVELTKTNYDENPVLHLSVFEEAGRKIGYVHYIQFTAKESELNAAFLELKNQGVTDLVLDLRYNLGGFAAVSQALASMITGQFKGEILTKQEWNQRYMDYFLSENGEYPQRRFIDRTTGSFSDEAINSLNLSSVHIITTGSSASASETLISGLSPYIDVTLIGETTSGKYTGGATLYDSPTFGKEGANPDHTSAIYPIFYTNTNSLGESWPNGIAPDILLGEDLGNMGAIGSRTEPLLNAAINDILGISAKTEYIKTFDYEIIKDPRIEKELPTDLIESMPELVEAMKKTRDQK